MWALLLNNRLLSEGILRLNLRGVDPEFVRGFVDTYETAGLSEL